MKISLEQQITEAVRSRCARRAGEAAMRARFERGMNHRQTLALFKRLTAIEDDDFEDLMYEADHLDSSPRPYIHKPL